MSTYEKLKTIENFELLELKVVMAAYERWSLMLARSSKNSDTGKLLVFLKTGR